MTDTVQLAKTYLPDDFRVLAERKGLVKVRVIGVSETDLVTSELFETLKSSRRYSARSEERCRDDRDDRSAREGIEHVRCVHQSFRLKASALASTHNAVCENLAIVGTNGADMAFAASELRRMGGGQIVVRDGKVLAAFSMPILCLFSDQPYEEVLERRRDSGGSGVALMYSQRSVPNSNSAMPARNFRCCDVEEVIPNHQNTFPFA